MLLSPSYGTVELIEVGSAFAYERVNYNPLNTKITQMNIPTMYESVSLNNLCK